MSWNSSSEICPKPPFGVIGSGSFGTAIANILAENGDVLIHTRRDEVYDNFLNKRQNRRQKVHENVQPTKDLKALCEACELIFLLVPSSSFRKMMQQACDYLKPHHVLIHGTKGFNIELPDGEMQVLPNMPLRKNYIRTMSEIMQEESVVLRTGCLSGPNLAMELAQKEPAATVIASRFDEVIEMGKKALKTDRFRVYGSHDVIGVEMAGVLKNTMAISSGILHGLGLGENAKAMLITRGLGEMVKIGKALGAETPAFLGVAGIGDLIATCSSKLSRNFRVGFGLAQNEKLEDILEQIGEVAEGINTVKYAKGVALQYNIHVPIIETLFDILYNHKPIPEAVSHLMRNKLDVDADYLWY